MIKMIEYDCYQCEECQIGFHIEVAPNDPVECPICPVPGCQSDMNRLVGVIVLPMPLPIIKFKEEGE